MARGILRDPAELHRQTPLVMRGSPTRTFGSLAGFLALGFLSLGVYLLGESLANPLAATQVSVLAAGVVLGIATVLLFYLIQPRRRLRGWRKSRCVQSALPVESSAALPGTKLRSAIAQRNTPAFPEVYKDSARLRR